MARIKIQIDTPFVFETSLVVQISDINYGGHLGNDKVQSMIHEARYRYIQSLGYRDELSIEGIGYIQADVAISFLGEGFHGDEIRAQIAVDDIGKKSFDLLYLLTNAKTGKEIARGKTGIVMYDYEQEKVASIPPPFLEKLSSGQ